MAVAKATGLALVWHDELLLAHVLLVRHQCNNRCVRRCFFTSCARQLAFITVSSILLQRASQDCI